MIGVWRKLEIWRRQKLEIWRRPALVEACRGDGEKFGIGVMRHNIGRTIFVDGVVYR